ncbi:MAG: UDP-N-acetylmuramoyl-L-alanyl-D-glutamate--2,6-diaminopimelate ligase [Sphingomonadaceae bacterium]|uniref:UDP-N-acetylmuramoyl-L-alanyl-D-glutamate--2, 6-diaminopimelate ligase n=1 Tax=Thermaurantiacus sp. TaxID=2820283 RepID=UPI00298EDC2B|nr:UDP-N-acetylmuramoyl-L-alanyl-D-glutamate--2,6-diaminopimelate ligase [Thermaurantiacus sp.]MCS6986913.1 UDP-N-acetylmuramoyl-L-alanyl-D-glutamate--2,6-diaminopimelate ligase [Sphingomonadaceae bacterium]MDW8415487.1 UDP-N-acetylmuramoyl-L-alanyl-D-glutamate--2,6-diaminopimelate ligase [Thermaurantiacus sp.]
MSALRQALGELAPRVAGFALDHRQVAPGYVFGAFPGRRANGEDFIPEAVARGAIAVVARPQARVEGALHVADADPRARFARLAAEFLAPFPPVTVAVTGTNGKTSTVELCRQLWHRLGERAASLGTLGVTTADDRAPAGTSALTTPDVVTFLSTCAGLAREGVTHLAFEASSHGLDQRRTEGLPLAGVAFTNLTRDHLDYHGTMEAYFAAKRRLFAEVAAPGALAVVWCDQGADGAAWNQRIVQAAKERGLNVLTVGPDGDDLRLVGRRPGRLGQRLEVECRGHRYAATLPLIGAYQAANALVAAGLVVGLGAPIARVLEALEHVQPIRGRLERVVLTTAGAPVYVDYAHTPDALASALGALRPHAAGRLILVFGCGGDRDPGKRPDMGRIAARDADVVIVTDDNPRHEDPATIRAQILAAAPAAIEVPDRRQAIARALALAQAGDVVLVAGKGHETGQIVGDDVLPFDDAEVARWAAREAGP